MQSKYKILVVGAGSPNADMVAEVLRSNGVDADWTDEVRRPSLRRIFRSDLIYGIYLQTCSRYILAAKLLGKKTIVHFVGSDAYWVNRERSYWRRRYWSFVLNHTDLIFYVSRHLEELVGRKGIVLPFPISTGAFREARRTETMPDRDILYYCPSGEVNERIYRLGWIVEYARDHPEEKITIIGNSSHPANYALNLPNVEVIPFVERSDAGTLPTPQNPHPHDNRRRPSENGTRSHTQRPESNLQWRRGDRGAPRKRAQSVREHIQTGRGQHPEDQPAESREVVLASYWRFNWIEARPEISLRRDP